MKPLLNTDPVYEKQSADFRGYYNEPFGSVVRFKDMRNMSGDDAPVIRTRGIRRVQYEAEELNGFFTRGNHVYWVDGNNLCDGNGVIGSLKALTAGTKRTFVNMGAYTIILPDKVMYDSAAVSGQLKKIEWTTESSDHTVTFAPCDIDGNALPAGAVAVYAKMGLANDMDLSGFKAGDVVRFGTSISPSASDKYYQLTKVNNVANSKWVVIIMPDIPTDQMWVARQRLSRLMPDMDFIVANNNRLWGCSSANHEVYCSALGDPTNWRTYQGLATDSWAATVGSDGDFTGAATHLGTVMFFKPDEIIKVYGDKPSNFQVSTQRARGVAYECEGTLCTMDENLYYLSQGRMVRYSGAWPEDVSMAWGGEKMCEYNTPGASGAGFGKVWTCVYSPERDKYLLMTYDGRTGHWHIEDEYTLGTRIWQFQKTGTAMLGATGNKITQLDGWLDGDPEEVEDPRSIVSWVMTGDLEMDVLEQLRVQKVMARVMVGPGATCEMLVAYDNGKDNFEDIEWETVGRWESSVPPGENVEDWEAESRWMVPVNRDAQTVYLVPRRCDHFRLALRCRGQMKVLKLNYLYKPGTEIRIK